MTLRNISTARVCFSDNANLPLANIDDPAWKDITKDFKGSVLTYGFADNADLKGKNAHLLSENGFVGVHFETEGIKNLSVDVDIPGKSMHTTHLRQFRQFHSLTKLKIR